MRDLTHHETKLIHEIAVRLPEVERDKLLQDLARASAESLTSAGSLVAFAIAGYERPERSGQHPYAVEGKVHDADGSELSVLLHADKNGHLFELELIRFDHGGVIAPDWTTLRLY